MTRIPVVLNVDDREESRYVRTRPLRAAGLVVVEATTAEETRRLIEELHPDLVLLDVHLGESTGLDVCGWMKGHPELRAIPVVLITASALTDEDKAAGLAAGADAYLTEPVPPGLLVANVRVFVRLCLV